MTKNYQFTQDWFCYTCQHWTALFRNLGWNREEPKMVLEIGSFEGQSSCWILENLIGNQQSKLFCLDTFEGGKEHKEGNCNLESLFERFSHNISVTGKQNLVQVCIGDSKKSLCALVCKNLEFDFIYVDGSHQAPDVLADAVMSWMLLKQGGLLIFDDYLWGLSQPDFLSSPKLAIDSFINCYAKQINFIETGQSYQLCLQKK